MLNATDNSNTVIAANAIELVTEAVIKSMGGDKAVGQINGSRQQVADAVAARINAKITLEVGAR